MMDDHPGEGNGLTLDDATRDETRPKRRGLFRRDGAISTDPGNHGGSARLRVVSRPPSQSPAHNWPLAETWDTLRRVPPGRRSAIVGRLAQGGDDPVAASFDHLRTELLRALRSDGLSRIAVAAPTRGCGATFSAVNLALNLARIPGNRTVLLDLNLRRPGVSRALDMQGVGNMRGFLRGSVELRDHVVRASDALAVGLAQTGDSEASHLLHGDCSALAVNDLMDRLTPDVLICDLPPVLEHDDLAAFLPQVDGVLLVADGMQTLPGHIAECDRRLRGKTRVLGVVLNQAQRAGPVPVHV